MTAVGTKQPQSRRWSQGESTGRVVHYVEHVVTGQPACGAALTFSTAGTSTADAVTCPACLERLGRAAVDPCTSCGLEKHDSRVVHRPHGHTVWCIWTDCGHHISRGHTACTEFHPTEKGTAVSEPTEEKPAAKRAAKKAATAPPPQPTGVFTPNQQRRLEALREAASLLNDGETRGTAGELVTLARYIEGDHVDDDPDAVLTFTPTTSTTTTEGAPQ